MTKKTYDLETSSDKSTRNSDMSSESLLDNNGGKLLTQLKRINMSIINATSRLGDGEEVKNLDKDLLNDIQLMIGKIERNINDEKSPSLKTPGELKVRSFFRKLVDYVFESFLSQDRKDLLKLHNNLDKILKIKKINQKSIIDQELIDSLKLPTKLDKFFDLIPKNKIEPKEVTKNKETDGLGQENENSKIKIHEAGRDISPSTKVQNSKQDAVVVKSLIDNPINQKKKGGRVM